MSEYGSVAFLSNMGDLDVIVTHAGKQIFMQNHSVYIVNSNDGSILFNSSAVDDAAAVAAAADTLVDAPRISEWEGYAETVGAGSSSSSHQDGPVEQLHLTGGFETDYLWYETEIALAETYKVTTTAGSGTVLYSYVNGQLLDTGAPDSLREGQQYVSSGAGGKKSAFSATTAGKEQQLATATLQILSVAMGLSNGGVGPGSRKGIYAAGPLSNNSKCRVHVNGQDVTDR